MKIDKINIDEKFKMFSNHWEPKIVGALNGQHVKLVKFKGSFIWHKHETEDEMFFVIQGNFKMHFRDQSLDINEGEFIIVPRGVEHRPEASAEVQVLLFEPDSTINTGNSPGIMTVEKPEWI